MMIYNTTIRFFFMEAHLIYCETMHLIYSTIMCGLHGFTSAMSETS